MISSEMERLLLVVVGVFLVFSLFGSRRRFVLIYSLSSQRAVLVVVDEADLNGFGVRNPVLLIS